MLSPNSRNVATSVGRSHKSIGVKFVLFWGQFKKGSAVWRATQKGQFGGTFGSILFNKYLSKLYPDLIWARVRLNERGRVSSVFETSWGS